jgi:hypothetical protein
MLPYRDSRITQAALGVFFIIVIGYAYFEARGMLWGPSITVTSQPTEVHEPFITIKGQAQHIASLSMNGKPIPVTEDGAFEEPYLLAPGDNRIMLDARDTYGRVRQQSVEVVYVPDAASTTTTTLAATTTISGAQETTPNGSSTAPIAPGQ